ncbi:hypothetical protein F9K33_09760 [bacterium]|nr:MAG: hypothetical protein F9K33_09760 [bacterium]
MKHIYPWKRLFYRREDDFNLSDDGFLADHEYFQPYGTTFDEIAKGRNCLVVLGESGIGKTYVFEEEFSKLKKESSLRFDLGQYGDESRFVNEIFNNETIRSWRTNKEDLYLFFDSLDEAPMGVERISKLLESQLRILSAHFNRLYVRISCRPSVWPHFLETNLSNMWIQSQTVYKLAPLTKSNIKTAADLCGCDAELFLKEIEEKELAPFAIKPLTLNLMLKLFHRDHLLPAKARLFYEGCLELCTERQDRSQRPVLSPEQKLRIAERIACLSLFCNKAIISKERSIIGGEVMAIADLSGSTETVKENTLNVTEADIIETLSTGLFSTRSENSICWAHRAYSEYLAASYLIEYKLETNQIIGLVSHSLDQSIRIVPQLYEVVAWLAGYDSGVFDWILTTKPDLLLDCDSAAIPEEKKKELVDRILLLRESQKKYQFEKTRYKKLANKFLTESLSNFIDNINCSDSSRLTALDIAGECYEQGIQKNVLQLALNKEEGHHIRVSALYCLAKIANNETRAALATLLDDEDPTDSDDQIKGCLLKILWPTVISTEKLFNKLTPPKIQSFLGSYQYFMNYELPSKLSKKDIEVALNWLGRQLQQKELSMDFHFERLIDEIVKVAWNNLTSDTVDPLVDVLVTGWQNHYRLFPQERDRKFFAGDRTKRQMFIKALIVRQDFSNELHIFQADIFSSYEDSSWLLQQAIGNDDPDMKKKWISALVALGAWDNEVWRSAVLDACEVMPEMRILHIWYVGPVDVNSELATCMRESENRRMKITNQKVPFPIQRVERELKLFEQGDMDAWWRLTNELSVKNNFYDHAAWAITKMQGWAEADKHLRSRLILAAKKYVLNADPQTNTWIGQGKFVFPALGGYRALQLLHDYDTEFIENLSRETWSKWAGTILTFPMSSGTIEDDNAAQSLVQVAYKKAPEEMIKCTLLIIDYENQRLDHLFILRRFMHCWDEFLTNEMSNKLKQNDLAPNPLGCLLETLLQFNNQDVIEYAKSLVLKYKSALEEEKTKAIVAASLLAIHTENGSWQFLWPIINENSEFGKQCIRAIVNRNDRSDFGERLIAPGMSERELADLYIWLVKQFPYSEDTNREGSGFVTDRERVERFRDSLPERLRKKGTKTSISEIKRIVNEFPTMIWLNRILVDAEEQTILKSWKPPTPAEVFVLVRNNRSRLIRSGDDLINVVIESLSGLDSDLQGELPTVRYLWNECGGNIYRPKPEADLSTFVAIHLKRDLLAQGVIINREVEIRQGEKTDIHIDLVSKDKQHTHFHLIIEVKGCWNKEVKSAMKTQLADRYLQHNQSPYGIYLVGWYECQKWDANDYKKTATPDMSLKEARQYFENQAKAVSIETGLTIGSFVLNCGLK